MDCDVKSLTPTIKDEDTSAPIPEEVCTGIQDGILCQCKRCIMCLKKIELSIDKDCIRKDSHKPFACNICNKRFSYMSRLEKHLRVHKGLKPFPCNICNIAFTQTTSLKHHFLSQHSTNIHEKVPKRKNCDICNKSISAGKLKMHIEKVHFGLLVKCEACGKTFSDKGNLQRHTDIIHLKKKQFICTECKKVFYGRETFRRHFELHQPREEYICSMCNRTFYKKTSLAKHIKLHLASKVCCEICGKLFEDKMQLKPHMVVHTDDSKFVCTVCGKSFKREANLQQHEHTHRDNRPHECNICGKTFKLRTHVKQHMAVHGITRNHKCVVCEKTFARKTQLNTHMSTHGL
ncbi:zinc finger protein OZF-like isoform X8 [Macrosteles quadrilineatus]|uniref:zinc finger protein OZF-like isoform X8 n=1 Tax=Macrosteles quadrilineatus TaxID=74068 RepID=UPI0023E0EBA9|nr:zinc finger protein OZF-like isoform X8 [Macrosteles quadrilineatus]